jgi:hypothetical protein
VIAFSNFMIILVANVKDTFLDRDALFDRFKDQGFIKTGERPVIESATKAALNRKGNELLNAGDVEGARRIFLTTGYSDGIARVGDHYLKEGRSLDALRMYWTAPDRTKAEAIISRLSAVIQKLVHEEEEK